eukprot:5160001-Alexandrium_andersonii.AAC.1
MRQGWGGSSPNHGNIIAGIAGAKWQWLRPRPKRQWPARPGRLRATARHEWPQGPPRPPVARP